MTFNILVLYLFLVFDSILITNDAHSCVSGVQDKLPYAVNASKVYIAKNKYSVYIKNTNKAITLISFDE